MPVKLFNYAMKQRSEEEDENVYSLVERIKEGDREAFMTVTVLYQKKVFLLAFSFFRDREDALDIVQETFLRFFQRAHLFRKGENFQNWLLRIARNLCIDSYRKNYSRKKDWEEPIDERKLKVQNESDPYRSSDLKEIFSRCLERLGERQRMVFVLKHYNQFKYREIAQTLNISLGTVKSLHFKAVQNMRALAAPYLGRER